MFLDLYPRTSGLLSEHAASLLAEHQSNLMDLMVPEHLRGAEVEDDEGSEEGSNLPHREELKPEIGIEAQDLSMDSNNSPLRAREVTGTNAEGES